MDNLNRFRAAEEGRTGRPAAIPHYTAIDRSPVSQSWRTNRASSITSCLKLRRNSLKLSAETLRRSELGGVSVFNLHAEKTFTCAILIRSGGDLGRP